MASWKKAQGASEYLILLAVVLIVGMVAISLLGGFTGIGGDARFAESKQYWTGASPFSVPEFNQINDTLYITLQNMQPDRLIITNITAGNSSWADATGVSFNGGARKLISIGGLTVCNQTSYDVYEYYVNITYSSSDIKGNVQHGAKPMTGKCA